MDTGGAPGVLVTGAVVDMTFEGVIEVEEVRCSIFDVVDVVEANEREIETEFT